jgi:hypothetical protein
MAGTPPLFTPRPLQRGVIARPAPEWWCDHACGGSQNITSAAGVKPIIGLYNNDPKGREFEVFGCELASTTALQAALLFVGQPTNFGTQQATVAMYSLADAPVGLTLNQPVAPLPPPGPLLTPNPFRVVLPSTGWSWQHDFPIAIVSPGNALFVFGELTQSQLSAAFWFIPIPL